MLLAMSLVSLLVNGFNDNIDRSWSGMAFTTVFILIGLIISSYTGASTLNVRLGSALAQAGERQGGSARVKP